MATFAVTLVWPTKSGERGAFTDGPGREIWRVTGDGATTSATLTPATLRLVTSVRGGTTLTHDIAPPTAGTLSGNATVALVWGTALGDGKYQDIEVEGLV